MPSDEALAKALAQDRQAFLSALATTHEQIRGVLSEQRAPDTPDHTLGRFAAGRIDTERFASLLTRKASLDAQATQLIECACDTLHELLAEGDGLFFRQVEPGTSFAATVGGLLAHIGRAFGAARVFEQARTARTRNGVMLETFPFERWNRAERRNAPPVVISVEGRDLHAGELSRYLDGSLKLIIHAEDPAPLAPLVPLITPRTFVIQTSEAAAAADLERMRGWDGPGVAAVLPDSCARFVHDPAGGAELWERLEVSHLPDQAPRPVGGRSSEQQADALRQLAALARRPEVPEPPAPPQDSVDQLASFLLQNAHLEDLG